MIDTHCHLTSAVFTDRVDAVIDEAVAAGIERLVSVAVTAADATAALALAERRPEVVCSSGVHPLYAAEPIDWETTARVASHPRCVAWGELGLDRFYKEPEPALQDRILLEQLDLIRSCTARGNHRPIIVHSREAVAPLLEAFGRSEIDPARFVFHCFTGTPEEADRIVAFGAMISFTGVVTYKSGRSAAESAARIPLDRIMVETDAPYLTPEPNRKQWPNTPRHVRDTAAHIAGLRGMTSEAFEAATDANARRFFGLADLPD